MNNKISDFIKLLFDPHESTCFGRDKYSVYLLSVGVPEALDPSFQFFSINPMHTSRADANVTTYRNILIEIDSLPLLDQQLLIEKLLMPHSSATYSAGKSIHYVISLETPCKDRRQYDSLIRRIYKVIKVADKANKNPSRFSRFPGHRRTDKAGQEQRLLTTKARVPNWLLEEWLESHGEYAEDPGEADPVGAISLVPTGSLNGFTMNLLMFGADEGARNSSLYKAAHDCCRSGLPLDKAKETLAPILRHFGSDFSQEEFKRTVESAYRKMS